VTVDQVKSANPFGHATVKVDGGQKVGLVPNSDKEAAKAVAKEAASAAAGHPTPSPVPGHVEPLAAGRTIEDTATLHVTPAQANDLLPYFRTKLSMILAKLNRSHSLSQTKLEVLGSVSRFLLD
jgi:hypothetical protein